MNFILKLIITTLAVMLGAYIMPGVRVDDVITALMVAIVLAFLNSIIKPVFIFLTLPITVFTLGLFLLAINAFIILIADYFISGFEVKSFWIALFFSIILALITSIMEALAGQKKENQ